MNAFASSTVGAAGVAAGFAALSWSAVAAPAPATASARARQELFSQGSNRMRSPGNGRRIGARGPERAAVAHQLIAFGRADRPNPRRTARRAVRSACGGVREEEALDPGEALFERGARAGERDPD